MIISVTCIVFVIVLILFWLFHGELRKMSWQIYTPPKNRLACKISKCYNIIFIRLLRFYLKCFGEMYFMILGKCYCLHQVIISSNVDMRSIARKEIVNEKGKMLHHNYISNWLSLVFIAELNTIFSRVM